jgi:hypothetical protein
MHIALQRVESAHEAAFAEKASASAPAIENAEYCDIPREIPRLRLATHVGSHETLRSDDTYFSKKCDCTNRLALRFPGMRNKSEDQD